MLSRSVSLLLLITACGRVQFERKASGAPDADATGASDASDAQDLPEVDAGPPCNLSAPFGTPVPITELNTGELDGTLRLLPDELSGYYWSGPASNREIYYVSRPDRATPFTRTLVTGGVNTATNEMDPTITSDGSVLVFRRSGPGDELYVATQVTPTTFSAATALTTLNTASTEAQSFMPLGRDELYFQSTRSGTGELYVSTRSGTTFSAPAQLVSLASGFDEGDPVVTPDGLTIYFRSTRVAPIGGQNIFMAKRATTADAFGAVTLVENVNSAADDGASWISPDDCRLYMSSDRDGTNDVFVATRGM